MKENAALSRELLGSGLTCSQAVLSVYCKRYDLPLAPAMRLASGFAGGIGLSGETCGAACGAVMALGLAYGPPGAAGDQAKMNIFRPTHDFLTRFAEANGSARCRDILGGLDLTDPAQAASLKQTPELAARCVGCVRSALDILDDLLPPLD